MLFRSPGSAGSIELRGLVAALSEACASVSGFVPAKGSKPLAVNLDFFTLSVSFLCFSFVSSTAFLFN